MTEPTPATPAQLPAVARLLEALSDPRDLHLLPGQVGVWRDDLRALLCALDAVSAAVEAASASIEESVTVPALDAALAPALARSTPTIRDLDEREVTDAVRAELSDRAAARRAQSAALETDLGLPASPAGIAAVLDDVDAIHLHRAAEETVTLGELITALSAAPPAAPVRYTGAGLDGQVPTGIGSWRGVYADLALGHHPAGPQCPPPSAAELTDALTAALGATFTGYKGGTYVMGTQTPVWVDNRGEAGGPGISGVLVAPTVVRIHTRARELG